MTGGCTQQRVLNTELMGAVHAFHIVCVVATGSQHTSSRQPG